MVEKGTVRSSSPLPICCRSFEEVNGLINRAHYDMTFPPLFHPFPVHFHPQDISIPPYVVQHDNDFWPEAHSFKPERFIDPTVRPHPYAFQTFSSGNRNCIGQFFATHEAVTIIMSTLRQFDVELACRPEEITEYTAITMKPRYVGPPKEGILGLPVRIKRRI
mmetsp:Transcript_19322/g.48339  ORF Transcript_19322/g.48339 Transcript_19322/m.48339 type:complete len:163 (+) Transcript_19322:1240-1728(+)